MLDDVSLIVEELEGEVTEVTSLVTDIKSTVESSYITDEIKVKRIKALIEDYGY